MTQQRAREIISSINAASVHQSWKIENFMTSEEITYINNQLGNLNTHIKDSEGCPFTFTGLLEEIAK